MIPRHLIMIGDLIKYSMSLQDPLAADRGNIYVYSQRKVETDVVLMIYICALPIGDST